jgi:hypothetical protein
MEARRAFLFAPWLDLFENDDKVPVGDLDIAVILDGQFVIGEVKQSRNPLRRGNLRQDGGHRAASITDILLFASIDREPTVLITKEIARLSEGLKSLSIAVRWYPLHKHNFDASPVR